MCAARSFPRTSAGALGWTGPNVILDACFAWTGPSVGVQLCGWRYMKAPSDQKCWGCNAFPSLAPTLVCRRARRFRAASCWLPS